MRLAIAALALALVAGWVPMARADGGSIRGVVQVTRPADVPASPILVYVVGFTETAPATNVIVAQNGKRFEPDLVGLTAGQSITFPNRDPLLHNVFSPTAERTFDLGSFPQGSERSRVFPKQGVIEIYCNIHPEMSATVVVLPNRHFVLADAQGRFELHDVPAGSWTVFAYSRRAAHPASAKVTVAAGSAAADTKLSLDEVKRDFVHANKYGETYRDDTTTYAPE